MNRGMDKIAKVAAKQVDLKGTAVIRSKHDTFTPQRSAYTTDTRDTDYAFEMAASNIRFAIAVGLTSADCCEVNRDEQLFYMTSCCRNLDFSFPQR
jgi:hypothetical protein